MKRHEITFSAIAVPIGVLGAWVFSSVWVFAAEPFFAGPDWLAYIVAAALVVVVAFALAAGIVGIVAACAQLHKVKLRFVIGHSPDPVPRAREVPK